MERATAFKADLFIADLICVQFDSFATELSPVVHEEVIGFTEFTAALPAHLPGIDPGWYSSGHKANLHALKIILPSIVAACTYGVVRDQITARICVEYFTIGCPQVFETECLGILRYP